MSEQQVITSEQKITPSELLTLPKFKTTSLKQGVHSFNMFNMYVEEDFDPLLLVEPVLWQNIGRMLKMGDEIRVMPEDLSWRALLVVTFADGVNIRVSIVNLTELNSDEVSLGSFVNDYETALKGPRRWCLVRKSDGEIIKEGIATKLEAERELDDYLRALVR